MTARKTIDGHPAHFDYDRYEWVFDDTGESAEGINRCRICAEENFIIPIEFLERYNPLEKYASVSFIKGFGGIPVDYCIHEEIMYLIENGVITLGCCCGHDKKIAEVVVDEEMIDKMVELGYGEYHQLYNEHYVFRLKGENFNV